MLPRRERYAEHDARTVSIKPVEGYYKKLWAARATVGATTQYASYLRTTATSGRFKSMRCCWGIGTVMPLGHVVGAHLPPSARGEIAFVSNRDGNTRLHDANPTARRRRISPTIRLTTQTLPGRPTARRSPLRANRDGNQDIYVMMLTGHECDAHHQQRRLDKEPAWSPDGTKIAFTRKMHSADA